MVRSFSGPTSNSLDKHNNSQTVAHVYQDLNTIARPPQDIIKDGLDQGLQRDAGKATGKKDAQGANGVKFTATDLKASKTAIGGASARSAEVAAVTNPVQVDQVEASKARKSGKTSKASSKASSKVPSKESCMVSEDAAVEPEYHAPLAPKRKKGTKDT
ncbi:hypothetical protein BN946_scf184873.g36 [Trametes cinnabarina]|uniref:Uncharacterized protein n=1 Tax=Pycnoporus cinnabarinus TaxID=5643 RepID=A0A060SN40_PYCCI|nr:hypothetical protein BN946_scf184873.g36 [Trametes cinnabarina]